MGEDVIGQGSYFLASIPMLTSAPPTEDFVAYFYSIIKQLPSADGCDAKLIVRPDLPDEPVGYYDPISGTISVALLPNPFDVLGTILHEVAHHNSRFYYKSHGYRWRRAFASLTQEFLDSHNFNILKDAEDLRRKWHREEGYYCSRSSALDAAVVTLLTEARESLGNI